MKIIQPIETNVIHLISILRIAVEYAGAKQTRDEAQRIWDKLKKIQSKGEPLDILKRKLEIKEV